jgi:hypothetical protein
MTGNAAYRIVDQHPTDIYRPRSNIMEFKPGLRRLCERYDFIDNNRW